jgi:hypothetical protein
MNPLTVNRYIYCRNNPLIYNDPTGLWSIKLDIAGFGFSVGDKGVSVTAFGLQLGVNFADSSVYGGFNLSVGIGFEVGGITAGFGAGIGYTHNFTHGGQDQFGANAGARVGFGGMGYGYGGYVDLLTKNTMSGGDFSWDLNESMHIYKKYVGNNPNMQPGGDAPGVNNMRERSEGESFVDGANCIGNPRTNEANNAYEAFIYDIFPGREGGFVSNLLNQIPGMNAFSYLHDSLYRNNYASASTDLVIAAFATYGAWIGSGMSGAQNINNLNGRPYISTTGSRW